MIKPASSVSPYVPAYVRQQANDLKDKIRHDAKIAKQLEKKAESLPSQQKSQALELANHIRQDVQAWIHALATLKRNYTNGETASFPFDRRG